MSNEARHFATVLERILRRTQDQFRDVTEADLNRPLTLPESNTAFVLATHLIGSVEYWVLELAGGRDVQRDRPSEFRASGTSADLIARYDRCLADLQVVLAAVPDDRFEQIVKLLPRNQSMAKKDPMTVRDSLLHAVEHAALHQGHLELTRQILGYGPAGAQ